MAVLALGTSVSAQGAPVTVSLTQALQMARQSGPLHRMAGAQELIGVGAIRESSQWANPSLEWRKEGTGSGLEPDIFTTATVPFDLSGRRIALQQSASAGRQRVGSEKVMHTRAADLEVARAFLRAGAARMLLHVAEGQAEVMAEVAAIDEQRLREGLVSEAVGLRTSIEADRARLNVVEARREWATAQAELSRLVGVQVAAGELNAPALPAPPDSVSAVAIAMRARPEVLSNNAAIRETERRLAAEQRRILGEVAFQGGTKKTNGVTGAQFGMSMPFPLFNRNDGARQRVRGELMQAEVQRDNTLSAVAGSVGVAWAHYREVLGTEHRASTFTKRGNDIGEIARTAYREGHIGLTELLDTERASSEALQTYIRWMTDAWLSRFELEWAMGARIDTNSALDLPLSSSLISNGGSL